MFKLSSVLTKRETTLTWSCHPDMNGRRSVSKVTLWGSCNSPGKDDIGDRKQPWLLWWWCALELAKGMHFHRNSWWTRYHLWWDRHSSGKKLYRPRCHLFCLMFWQISQWRKRLKRILQYWRLHLSFLGMNLWWYEYPRYCLRFHQWHLCSQNVYCRLKSPGVDVEVPECFLRIGISVNDHPLHDMLLCLLMLMMVKQDSQIWSWSWGWCRQLFPESQSHRRLLHWCLVHMLDVIENTRSQWFLESTLLFYY